VMADLADVNTNPRHLRNRHRALPLIDRLQPEDDPAGIPLTSDYSQHVSISSRGVRSDEVAIHPEPLQRQPAISHASPLPGIQGGPLDEHELRGSGDVHYPITRKKEA
jgi:hypothetical protein